MRASALEFRMRFAIIVLLVVLGFWSPWIEALRLGKRVSLLEWLALELSRLGLLHFTESTPVVIVCGAVIAALGVVLRLWGTAYLGTHVVQNQHMKAGTLRSDGPYRYLRNPLYLGLWCMLAAMSLVMPASGALVSMVLITVFLLRLILAEEAFLTTRLGEPYTAYLQTVPRLVPRLRSNVLAGDQRPNWTRALLFELNPIGVFVTIAVLSWRYDHLLMMKALVISFGVSLVARALLPRPSDPAPAVH